jgi:hypothetical protein
MSILKVKQHITVSWYAWTFSYNGEKRKVLNFLFEPSPHLGLEAPGKCLFLHNSLLRHVMRSDGRVRVSVVSALSCPPCGCVASTIWSYFHSKLKQGWRECSLAKSSSSSNIFVQEVLYIEIRSLLPHILNSSPPALLFFKQVSSPHLTLSLTV